MKTFKLINYKSRKLVFSNEYILKIDFRGYK